MIRCLNDSPIDLDANILSATVNVAGGGVAVNVALVGNLIVNTTKAMIEQFHRHIEHRQG